MVTMTIVTIVIVARGRSSITAVTITRRKPIVAAIVSHSFVTLWSTVVLASCGMTAWTAIGVAACWSTASSRCVAATIATEICWPEMKGRRPEADGPTSGLWPRCHAPSMKRVLSGASAQKSTLESAIEWRAGPSWAWSPSHLS